MTIAKTLRDHLETESLILKETSALNWIKGQGLEGSLCPKCGKHPVTELHHQAYNGKLIAICNDCHLMYFEQDNCPYDVDMDEIADKYYGYEQYRPNYSKIKRQVITSLSEDDWRARYREYLKSDEWKQKRNLVIRRCGGFAKGALAPR